MRHYAAAKQYVKDLYSSYMKIKQSLKDCIFKSAAGRGGNEKNPISRIYFSAMYWAISATVVDVFPFRESLFPVK